MEGVDLDKRDATFLFRTDRSRPTTSELAQNPALAETTVMHIVSKEQLAVMKDFGYKVKDGSALLVP